MSQWFFVARRSDLQDGEMRAINVGGRRLVVGLIEGRLHAFQGLCPHASAPLDEGTLRPDYVICPLHAYRFDLSRGRCLKPRDGPRLRLYRVELREEEIWVEIDG